MSQHLSDLAIKAAEAIEKEPGVNGVIVIVMYCGDEASMTGSAYRAPNINVDHVIGNAIEAIASLRQNARAAAVSAAEAAKRTTPIPTKPEGSQKN